MGSGSTGRAGGTQASGLLSARDRARGCGFLGQGAPTPHQTCCRLSWFIWKQPLLSWRLASRVEEKRLVSAIPAFTSPSCPAELVWGPRDAPQGGPSHPTTSGILRSTSHPTNIYGALLGPSSQSRPDAEFDLAEVPTLKLGIRSGSRGAAWLSTSPSHRPQAPQLGCRVNDLVGSTGSNPLNLGFKVLGPHREARQIQCTQFVLSLVSHSKVGGSCLRVFP